MNVYEVRKITHTPKMTIDEYNEAYNSTPTRICNGLKEVWAYCGGKLPRQRFGYSGMRGNVEYSAVRVK